MHTILSNNNEHHKDEESKLLTKRQRILYFDLAKGICIIFVVWFHIGAQCEINTYLNPIRMPLYFFLSGLFFKDYGKFITFIKKKTNNLLIPFLFFYLTTSVILPLAMHHAFGMNFATGNDWNLLFAFLTSGDYPNIPLWFLWGLFILNIVFYGLKRRICNDLTLGIVCLVLHCVCGYYLELPSSLNNTFKGLFFRVSS